MINSSDLKLTAVSTDIKRISAGALVLGVVKGSDGPTLVASPFSPKLTESLEATLALLNASGAADELTRLPAADESKAEFLAFIGLGSFEESTLTEEVLRRGAGSATRQLAGTTTVVFALPTATVTQAGAVAEGIALGAYDFSNHRSTPSKKLPLTEAIIATAASTDKDLPAALKRAAILGRAVRATRDLVNTAPNVLFPESFAQAVKDTAKGSSLKVTVIDDKKLEKDGYGGLMGVGRGSDRGPRLVKVEYSPAKAAKHLALVGKGITFDTGGISIKPAAGMHAMKNDMAGAATIHQAITAIAELALPIKVTAWLCLAENMPGGGATRPGDVITMFGGKTVEVLNTDAEGRLVMCDALTLAVEDKVDAVIDIATLTGAALMALGQLTAALLGNDQELIDAVRTSAANTDEQVWQLPLERKYRKQLDSDIADISNLGGKYAGATTAALFLEEFVGQTPWAHLDIAGTMQSDTNDVWRSKGATGFGTRTLIDLAQNFSRR